MERFLGGARGLSVLATCLAVAAGGCRTKVTDSDIRFAELSEVRALTLQQERDPAKRIVAMIDARSSARFDDGHVPGARNLRLPELPRRGRKDPELDRYRHVIVYGENPSTPSARGMTKRLMVFGYDGVRLFAGGMSEWRQAGYPVASVDDSEQEVVPEP